MYASACPLSLTFLAQDLERSGDVPEALRCYQRAAALGHAPAHAAVAWLHIEEEQTSSSSSSSAIQGYTYAVLGSEQGCLSAKAALGYCLLMGIGAWRLDVTLVAHGGWGVACVIAVCVCG